jgi:hypothetical protein
MDKAFEKRRIIEIKQRHKEFSKKIRVREREIKLMESGLREFPEEEDLVDIAKEELAECLLAEKLGESMVKGLVGKLKKSAVEK